MKTKIYTTLFTLTFLFFFGNMFGQYSVLYLTSAENNLEDSLLIDFLGYEGYDVTLVLSADFKAAPYDTPDAYADYDVLFVSESIGSSDANNFKTAGFPIPAVSTEGYGVRTGRWDFQDVTDETTFLQISSSVVTEDAKTLVILDNEHYITMDYDLYDEIVWTSVEGLTSMGVTGFNLDNVDGAIALGQYKDASFADFNSLFAIPEGSEIIAGTLGGTYIESNIVMFGVIAAAMQYPTEDYKNIILRSIQWATDNRVAVENELADFNVKVGPNPTTGSVNFSFNLDSKENVAFNLYDLSGKLVMSKSFDNRPAGRNTLEIDLGGQSNGVFLYEINTGTDVLNGKICKY